MNRQSSSDGRSGTSKAISTGLSAKDSETLEEMVVYRALYGEGGLWVRSASCDRFAAQSLRSFGQPDACGAGESAKMFFETVERDGRTMKRFELVEDAK